MTGICAGHPTETALGDVVIADRIFKFDEGKREVVKNNASGETEETVFHDIKTFNIDRRVKAEIEKFSKSWTPSDAFDRPKTYEHQRQWLLWALDDYERNGGGYPADLPERTAECRDWPLVIIAAERDGLMSIGPKLTLTPNGRAYVERLRTINIEGRPKDPAGSAVRIGPMGTSAMVHKDRDLFDRLRLLLRKILSVEMEAAAVAEVAQSHQIPFLVVKAVVDHADLGKNDNFRRYASEVSADFAMKFVIAMGKSTSWSPKSD
jgi:nucleoside phosphorylase